MKVIEQQNQIDKLQENQQLKSTTEAQQQQLDFLLKQNSELSAHLSALEAKG